MKKDKIHEETIDAFAVSKCLLELFKKINCKPEIAYAALGTAFSSMHLSLGKNKQDWLEITKHMAELLVEKDSTKSGKNTKNTKNTRNIKKTSTTSFS